mmetsp:Transcript_8276/g.11395  ORF Transcript_8276/g.11395 Transcript_8276/m.11395 type:complete len:301 (+) Transcript_8276:144-1046(+)
MDTQPNNSASQHPVSDNNNKDEQVTDEEDSNEPTFKGFRDIGVCSDQNWKHRRRMEDAHYIEDAFNNNPEQAFFAVYDGHGGKECANFCAENLHKILKENLDALGHHKIEKEPQSVLEVLKTTYLHTDNKIKEGGVPGHHGCTSVTCFIAGSLKNSNRQLFCANAGDGRAVLCRDGKAIRLTEDHKVSNEVEAQRIKDVGGFIINGRVNGQIIITRSLGDHLMKEYIIGEPYTRHEVLSDKDTHLIVACDGLWDVVEDQQAVDFVLQHDSASASDIAKKLLVKALQDGSTDNLSIIVVKL